MSKKSHFLTNIFASQSVPPKTTSRSKFGPYTKCPEWNWARQGSAPHLSVLPESWGLLKRFWWFGHFSTFWPTLEPKSYYKNVKIMLFKGQFQMDHLVNSHLSYSLLRNSKIHFLSLSSHFEKIWSIVQDKNLLSQNFVKSTTYFWEKTLLSRNFSQRNVSVKFCSTTEKKIEFTKIC